MIKSICFGGNFRKMTLAELEIGGKAKISEIKGETPVTKRLMEMGVLPGVSVRVVKTAPFGDPIEIRVRGYSLALRKSEAETIQVENLFNKNQIS